MVTMFTTVLAFLGAFTGLNVHGAISIRYFQQDRFELPVYISTCLTILLISTIALMCIVWSGQKWLVQFTLVPAKWLLIAVIISGAQFVVQIPLYLWRASNQPFRYAAMQISQSVLNAAFSLWLVLGLNLAWVGRAAGQSISVFLIMCFSLFFLIKTGWAKGTPRKDYAWDMLKFGVPLIPHVIGGVLLSMTDRIMITNLLDVSQTGIYMVSMQIGMALGLLTDSFNKSFGPWLFGVLKDISPSGKMRIVRYTYLYFLAVTALAIILGLIAPWLLGILVGEKFRQASGIVIYNAMGFAFGGMYYMVTNYIFYMSKTYILAIITGSCGIFNVIINYFLIQRYGLKGASLGFMISQAIFFFATWFFAHRIYPMPWKKAVFSLYSVNA